MKHPTSQQVSFDCNYFLNKFEKIPEHLWITGDWEKNSKMCANGHCGVKNGNMNYESIALNDLFKIIPLTVKDCFKHMFHLDGGCSYERTVGVNDGYCNEYNQPTPRLRILAALNDIKNIQEPKPTEKPKKSTQ